MSRKRKVQDDVSILEPLPRSSKATLLGSSRLLLGIPTDINTSLPVWEAVRSQKLDISWTVNPYSICVHLTPVTSKQGEAPTSSQSKSTSSVAQTSSPSSSILLHHPVIQSVAQQQGSPQNTSLLLLTSSPNNSQSLPSFPDQTQNISPTPMLGTSPTASLPVIIPQPQPALPSSTPTKKEVLPVTQTPKATPTQLPVPSPFHTKSSSDIPICEKFLLNLCHAGSQCKMHHTPYPFHWQMWCVQTHKWIDFPLHCQVLLERMYCNVNHNVICIKDGNVRYSLIFDSMELDESSKYDAVRRLTNSDRWALNPFFSSKWKIYWWNNFNWEEYNVTASTLLLEKMSKKEPECSFHIGSQEYKVDFTIMIQTNVKTGFQREVRCRPAYRSPDSMQMFLKTGIQIDPTKPVCSPSAANFSVDPLEDFSSWYPPVWCLAPGQDYSLVDVPAGTQPYKKVKKLFHDSLSETKMDIVSIQQVQNLLHWDKYQRHKVYMQKLHTKSKEPLERHLFHGTTKEASEDICHNNFDPRVSGVNGTSCGYGTYFATEASLSDSYAAKAGPDQVCHMFLAKVLVGNASLGRTCFRRPPPLKSKTEQYRLYDTCVDKVLEPSMFVVFDSCQCYPYYLIKYKGLPKEIEI